MYIQGTCNRIQGMTLGTGVFLPPCFRQGLFTVHSGIHWASWLMSWRFSWPCLPSVLGSPRMTDASRCAELCVGSGDLSSGAHVCVTLCWPGMWRVYPGPHPYFPLMSAFTPGRETESQRCGRASQSTQIRRDGLDLQASLQISDQDRDGKSS